MNIHEALTLIQLPNRYVARPEWGHRCYLLLAADIIMFSHNGYDTPWMPSHLDLFATDWEEVIPHP